MFVLFCVPSVGCGEASGAASVTLRGSFSALKQPIKLWSQKLSSPIPSCCYEWCFVYLGYQEGVNNDLSSWGGLIFGPGSLRAPCVLACAMRSLAIIITYFRSFGPGGFACATRGGVAMRSWPLFLSLFSLSLSLSLSFSPFFAFDPLRRISHVRNNFSPNIWA